MTIKHLLDFLSSLSDGASDDKVKFFSPSRNFNSFVEVRKAYLVLDSSGDDTLVLSSDDLNGENFRSVFNFDK